MRFCHLIGAFSICAAFGCASSLGAEYDLPGAAPVTRQSAALLSAEQVADAHTRVVFGSEPRADNFRMFRVALMSAALQPWATKLNNVTARASKALAPLYDTLQGANEGFLIAVPRSTPTAGLSYSDVQKSTLRFDSLASFADRRSTLGQAPLDLVFVLSNSDNPSAARIPLWQVKVASPSDAPLVVSGLKWLSPKSAFGSKHRASQFELASSDMLSGHIGAFRWDQAFDALFGDHYYKPDKAFGR